MKLTKVTITGIDDQVAGHHLDDLAKEFPFVEFGILCSSSSEGKNPRYPSKQYVDHLLDIIAPWTPLAAHLCGQYSRDATTGAFLWAISRGQLFDRVARIQFNGIISRAIIDRLASYAKHFPQKQYILQTPNFAYTYALATSSGDYLPAFLLDQSGGKGIELDDFQEAPSFGSYGYAGGFGPDNLQSVLEKLTAIKSNQSFWVDMESKVRVDDRLDLAKVRKCLEIAAPFIG